MAQSGKAVDYGANGSWFEPRSHPLPFDQIQELVLVVNGLEENLKTVL